MAEKNKKPTAIVVGAGVGGVAVAARLAKAGFAVTVFEKNDFTGGRCSLLTHEGHRFDQGPSLLLLPHLFHSTFADLGTSVEAEGLEFRKCEPNYTLHFADGEKFRLSTSLDIMRAEICRFEGTAGFARYLSFLSESHQHYTLSVREVLNKSFHSITALFRPSFLSNVIQLHPFESIYARASKYFKTERLRRVFTFASMYMGMSPFEAPGTYSLLQYTELAEGVWYPKGGFHTVVQKIVDVGEREGVEYRLGCGVERVLVDKKGGRAEGVLCENGMEYKADVVVVNADLVWAYNNLFSSPGSPSRPSSSASSSNGSSNGNYSNGKARNDSITKRSTLSPPARSAYAKSLQQRAGSCSSISFYWSMNRTIPQLNTHNIFLADHYRESFDSIFKDQSIPVEPSFYVNVPSRIDPSAAPPGRDSIIVLVPVGHLQSSSSSDEGISKELDWEQIIADTRAKIISTVSSRIGIEPHELASAISHEIINDPFTWRDKFNLHRGSILGLSHSFFNVLSFRPKIRHEGWNVAGLGLPGLTGRGYENVYFVGASTQPGTGVPIVLAGARLVAEAVCEDLGVRVPWDTRIEERVRMSELGGMGGKEGGELGQKREIDRVKGGVMVSTFQMVLLALLTTVILVLLGRGGLGVLGFLNEGFST